MEQKRHQEGTFRTHLEKIEGSLDDIKDDLASAIRSHSVVTRELTAAVKDLSNQIKVWDRAVPIKLVAVMFAILIASIGTIETIRTFLPILKTL